MAQGMTTQTASPPQLHQMVTFRLSRLNARLNAQATKILAKSAGITLMQWRVFVMLESLGRITPSDIVRQTGLDKSQLSRAIKTMIEQGLVTSQSSESDQRAHYIRVTEKGLSVFHRARPLMRNRQERLSNALDQHELEVLFRAFEKLDPVVDEMDAQI